MGMSTFLGKKLLPTKTPKKREVFRKCMRLYNGSSEWEVVTNVKVSGQMSNGRKTYDFDTSNPDLTYLMCRDAFNGEFLISI